MFDLKNSKIFLTGGNGFLGRHVYNELIEYGVPAEKIFIPRKKDSDLRRLDECLKVLDGFDIIIHLAANFDGLKYNTEHSAEVFYDNAAMGLNLIEAGRQKGVKKFVLAGTVGSYPKTAPIPFIEQDYWNGLPEQGNDSYGLSKKFVAAQLAAYRQQHGLIGINLVLANMYGPNDHFELTRANVVPALVFKFIEARDKNLPELVMWGTGQATREFLYVKDAAKAFVKAAANYDAPEPVNIGSGTEVKISDLSQKLADLVGYKGKIVWDKNMPEGQKRRVCDVSLAEKSFGFSAQTGLDQGLKETYEWFLQNAGKK
jgi:GDP-L-fucose synthase